MKKLVVLAIILSSLVIVAYESGPLPENTGAPNEMTCYRSSCHTNSGSGNAQVFLRFTDTAVSYKNMDTLLLEFGFSKVFSAEHGFQMVALDSLNQNAGEWLISGSNQYQQISGFSFPNRKYLEHTLPGKDSNSWQVEWISPLNYQGDIKFYASFLETNDDNYPTGDTLYNLQLSIHHENEIGISKIRNDEKAFSTAFSENTLIFHNHSGQTLNARVFSLNGANIYSFQSEAHSSDFHYLKTGIYVLSVSTKSQSSYISEKIVVP